MRNFALLIIVSLLLCTFQRCTVTASFTEGRILGKNFAIAPFKNEAALAQSSFTQNLMDGLRMKIINESNLKYVDKFDSATYLFKGTILQYDVTPISATNGTAASMARLTVKVDITCDTNYGGAKNAFIKKPYTEYSDFSASETFSSIEETLMKDIINKITQQIYLDLLAASSKKDD